jgi:hypothetical protein
MAHRGAGAPPPSRSSGGGNSSQPIYHLSESVTTANGPQMKLIKSLKLRPGTKNQPILALDDFQDMGNSYSINIHMFNLRGTKDNIVVCPMTESDPRPCPLCEALNKTSSWYECLTAIDRQEYTFERKDKDTGKMGSVTYTDLRRLVLVTNTWSQRMSVNSERAKGWRGSLFEVSRSEPVKKFERGKEVLSYKDSPRIGDVWYFTEKYDEEKMKAELEKRAANYGMPVEQFIQPINYDVVLKPKSHQELTQIANDIKSDGSKKDDFSSSDFVSADLTAEDKAKAEKAIDY